MNQKWVGVRLGSPEADSETGFNFKWLIWEIIPGSNSEGEGKQEGKGRNM